MSDDIDFRTGASYAELSELIEQFDELDRHEFDDQMALEVHSMKEHIFYITGKLSQVETRFPIANEYMLLSGGLKSGSIHIDSNEKSNENITSRGEDYDLDYTLLVPVLKVGSEDHPDSVIMDMRQSHPCHTFVALKPETDSSLLAWEDCFVASSVENTSESGNEKTPDNITYLSPTLISKWFANCLVKVCEDNELFADFKSKEKTLGIPNILSVKRKAPGVTLILACGGTRIQYDLIPVISFQGWPKAAEKWLKGKHIFSRERECMDSVTKGFHLIPPFSISGDEQEIEDGDKEYFGQSTNCVFREWRLCFARSEVTIKKVIPMSFMKSFYAFMAIMSRKLERYRKQINPYSLRSIFFIAADRLPYSYLQREDKVAANLLGLIDDVLQCILTKSCPNYFINTFNIFADLKDDDIKILYQIILMVRSDAVDFLHESVQKVRMSRQISSVERNARLGKKTDVIGVDYTGTQQLSNDRAVAPIPFTKKNVEREPEMVEKVKRLIETNKGKSISVFLNPEDVTKAHFRVDDNFF